MGLQHAYWGHLKKNKKSLNKNHLGDNAVGYSKEI